MKLLFVWHDGRMRAIEHPEAPPIVLVKSRRFNRTLPEPRAEDVIKHDIVLYEEAQA
jgi:hypothetical protein